METGLMISTAGVLTGPVSEVLTISVEKDPGEVETMQRPVHSIPQIVVPIGEPEEKLREIQNVTSITGLQAREEFVQMMGGNGSMMEKTNETEAYANKPGDIEKNMPVADSHNTSTTDNLQYIIVKVKASEPVELIRKLVVDTIKIPLSKASVYYRGNQVRYI